MCAAALALALLVTACASVAPTTRSRTAHAATATAISTPTLPPAAPLAWQPHTLPVPLPATPDSRAAPPARPLAVTPGDGATAYECMPQTGASNAAIAVWQTHDRGDHWARTADLAVDVTTVPATVVACRIIPDAVDPAVVAIDTTLIPRGCEKMSGCPLGQSYASADAGQSWHELHGPHEIVTRLATVGTATYALFETPPQPSFLPRTALAVSHDGMRTWVALAGPPGGGHVTDTWLNDFWLNPYDGGLLAFTYTGDTASERFWSSSDGGHTWASLPAAPIPFDVSGFVVQQPLASQPWHLCGGDTGYANASTGQRNAHTHDVACTTDGGATWNVRTVTAPDDAAGDARFTLVAIADDGSLLITTPSGLQRLAPGDSRQDALGPIPNARELDYASGNGSGVLWAGPLNRIHADEPGARVYTASYA